MKEHYFVVISVRFGFGCSPNHPIFCLLNMKEDSKEDEISQFDALDTKKLISGVRI